MTDFFQNSPAPHPPVLRLQKLLIACSNIQGEDIQQSQAYIIQLVEFLDSIFVDLQLDSCDEDSRKSAFELLSEIYNYVSSPFLDQKVIDDLSFELLKAVSKFSAVDDICMEMVDRVIQLFIDRCSSRDMLSILCEALEFLTKELMRPSYSNPIIKGLSRVILSIQRRHFEHLKVAVPVIINCLKAFSVQSDVGDSDMAPLFERAISIASSIHSVSIKLMGKSNENLLALLGLYVLEIMALASISMGKNVRNYITFVSKLSIFFSYCGLSYLGFITGSDIDMLTTIIPLEEDEDSMSCFSDVNLGAALAVVWGHISVEVAQAAGENLDVVIEELRSDQAKRWQTIGMLKYILSFPSLPLELKEHSIIFLNIIMDGRSLQSNQHIEYSSYMPKLFSGLQAVEMFIMYVPDVTMSKNAFDALKKALADIPLSPRFDILKALITDCRCSSMIAILLDFVKEGLVTENQLEISIEKNKALEEERDAPETSGFWNNGVLELVEFVLRPPQGGPPCLPEQSDAVLSALNLYRFVLITESTGKSKRMKLLSKKNLAKACNEWFLPLHNLVTLLIGREESALNSELACALNPLESVLLRCIELTEQHLKLP